MSIPSAQGLYFVFCLSLCVMTQVLLLPVNKSKSEYICTCIVCKHVRNAQGKIEFFKHSVWHIWARLAGQMFSCWRAEHIFKCICHLCQPFSTSPLISFSNAFVKNFNCICKTFTNVFVKNFKCICKYWKCICKQLQMYMAFASTLFNLAFIFLKCICLKLSDYLLIYLFHVFVKL